MRGRNHVEAASGTMPSRPKTKPIRALVEASRMSIASVIVAPMPTAAPLIAAITGLGSSWIARVTLPPVSRTPCSMSGSSQPVTEVRGRRGEGLVEPEDVAVGGEVHARRRRRVPRR